jgi:hypothetical protein
MVNGTTRIFDPVHMPGGKWVLTDGLVEFTEFKFPESTRYPIEEVTETLVKENDENRYEYKIVYYDKRVKPTFFTCNEDQTIELRDDQKVVGQQCQLSGDHASKGVVFWHPFSYFYVIRETENSKTMDASYSTHARIVDRVIKI